MDPWQRWPWLWAQHAETRHPLCGYRGATWCFMPWKRSQTVRYCSDLSIQSSLCWSHSLWYSMKTLLPRECSLISFWSVTFCSPEQRERCDVSQTKRHWRLYKKDLWWKGHHRSLARSPTVCQGVGVLLFWVWHPSKVKQRSMEGWGGRLCVHILNRTSTVRQSVFWKNYKVKTYIYYIAKSIGSPPSNEQVWLL